MNSDKKHTIEVICAVIFISLLYSLTYVNSYSATCSYDSKCTMRNVTCIVGKQNITITELVKYDRLGYVFVPDMSTGKCIMMIEGNFNVWCSNFITMALCIIIYCLWRVIPTCLNCLPKTHQVEEEELQTVKSV